MKVSARCDGEEKDDDVLDGCKLTLNLLKGEKKRHQLCCCWMRDDNNVGGWWRRSLSFCCVLLMVWRRCVPECRLLVSWCVVGDGGLTLYSLFYFLERLSVPYVHNFVTNFVVQSLPNIVLSNQSMNIRSINCSSWKDDGFSIRMADVVVVAYKFWLVGLSSHQLYRTFDNWFSCWFLFTILPLFLLSSRCRQCWWFSWRLSTNGFLLVTSQMYKDWLLLLPFYTLQSSEGSDSSQGALVDIGEEVGVRCWLRRQSCLPSCSSWWCVIINNYQMKTQPTMLQNWKSIDERKIVPQYRLCRLSV